MNLYQTQTDFNCGIDLHKKSMYVCLMDRKGDIVLHRKIRDNDLAYFLKLVSPYAHSLTVCCEATYNWYFLHDFCIAHGFSFALGHALMIRAIHQSKKKNDRVDSETLANLLRTNMLPVGYCCPKEIRDVRDLLRRRLYLVQHRAALKTYLTLSVQSQGYEHLTTSDKYKGNRRAALMQRSDSEMIQLAYETTVDLIEAYDAAVMRIEKRVKAHTLDVEPELYWHLRSYPGIGDICAWTLLFEIADISRFKNVNHFCSYCRVVFPNAESDGKKLGSRGTKQGNVYLKWAFSEILALACSKSPSLKRYFEHLEKKHGSRKARNILTHRYARAVYYSLKRRVPFDLNAFFRGKKHFIDETEQTSDSAEPQVIPA